MKLFVADTLFKVFVFKLQVWRCKYIHRSLVEGEQWYCTKCKMTYCFDL